MAKTKLITVVINCMFILLLAVGSVFAYYYISQKGWAQEINIVSVYLKYNNRNINYTTNYNPITNTDFQLLSRGDSVDINMEVQVKGNTGGMGGYSIGVEFEDVNTDSVVYGLERAIEVYRYNDGDYEFYCMLNQLKNVGIRGTIPMNSYENYYFKLVYSDTAGEFYENKTFKMTLKAQSANPEPQKDVVYIQDEESLISANDEGNAGKILTLINDISLTSDILFRNKIGLDLNGHNLNLNAHNLKIGDNGGYICVSNDKDYSIIKNSSPTKGGIKGTGKIIINCPSNDVLRIENSLFDAYGSFITINNATKDAIVNEINENVAFIANKYFAADEKIDVSNGLKAYFGDMTFDVELNSSVASDGDGVFTVKSGIDVAYPFIVSVNVTNPGFDIEFRVRGNTAKAAAQYALDNLPETISGSIYLPAYDSYTKATLTFVVDDSDYIDQNGLYLPNGVDSLANWWDKQVLIGVIADMDGEQAKKYKTVTIEIFNAQERTNKIYDFGELLAEDVGYLADNDDSTTEIPSLYTLLGISDENKEKSGLKGIKLSNNEGGYVCNGYTSKDGYINIDTDENGYITAIRILNRPQLELYCDVKLKLAFVYDKDGSGTEIEYSFDKTLTISGYIADSKNSDPTDYIQQGFDENMYYKGQSFYFDGKAYMEYGAFVEYEIDNAYAKYLMVENNVIIEKAKNEEGKYSGARFYCLDLSTTTPSIINKELEILEERELHYFTALFNKTVDESGAEIFVPSETGKFVLYKANDGTEHYLDITDKTAYDMTSRFYVAAENVPAQDITVPLKAMVYTWESDTSGNYYKKYAIDETGSVLTYDLSLFIKGIYHNKPDEIANKKLYNIMLSLYDFNGNGFIEVTEAQTEWSDCTSTWNDAKAAVTQGTATAQQATLAKACNTYVKSLRGYGGYTYIDLSEQGITENNGGIKGLEYFTHLQGVNFANTAGKTANDNNIIDISKLTALTELSYLNLSGNSIVNIESLSYLDNLGYIDLANNGISDIEPLRYLPSVKYLNLKNNYAIASYNSIEEYGNLLYLNVVSDDVTKRVIALTEVYYTMYLLKDRNNGTVIYVDGNTPLKATDAQKAAALVMSRLLVINEAYTTLHIPTEFTYNGVTYNLIWDTPQGSKLTFSTTNKKTTGYTIVSPIVDTMIEIYLSINSNSGATEFQMRRKFYINLLKSQDASGILYVETSQGIFEVEKLVSDSVLLAALFNNMNTVIDGTLKNKVVKLDDENSYTTDIPNSQIITIAEMEAFQGKRLDLKNLGIKSLAGLDYFKTAFVGSSIDLTGNVFVDADKALEKLSELGGLAGLTLSAQLFDFTKLADYTGNAEGGEVGADTTKLTTLTKLDISGCYDLADEEVLKALYRVYMSNPSVKIYKDSATKEWYPYEIPLAKYLTNMPQQFALSRYKQFVNYYTGINYVTVDDDISGKSSIDFTFYGINKVTMTFAQSDGKIFGAINASVINAGETHTFENNLINTDKGIYLSKLVSYKSAAYQELTLSGNDDRSESSVVTGNYAVKLILEVYPYLYLMTNDGQIQLLSSVFTGRTMRQKVLNALSDSVFNQEPIVASETKDIIGKNGFYTENGKYYISEKTLEELSVGPSITVDGAYTDGGTSISGLHYLKKVTALNIAREAFIGDGSELINLKSLSISFSTPDFTKLTVELSKLTTLDIGGSKNNYFVDFGYGDCFSHMPNLTTLKILNSRVYNWGFLEGLKENDSPYIQTLEIYEKSGDYSNRNATQSSTIWIINAMFERFVKEFNKTPNYYIGTYANPRDYSTPFNPDNFEIVDLGALELPDGTGLAEFKEFKDDILDLGVKVNGSLHSSGASQEIGAGGKIVLPTSSFDLFFGTDFYGNEAYSDIAKYYSRSFPITWKVYGANSLNFANLFTYTNATAITKNAKYGTSKVYYTELTASSTQSEITLTAKSVDYDYYVVFEGKLGYSGTDGTATGNSFLYPVLIKGTKTKTDNVYTVSGNKYLSYKAFSDKMLRLTMFFIAQGISVNCSNESNMLLGCIRYDGINGFENLTEFNFNVLYSKNGNISALSAKINNKLINAYQAIKAGVFSSFYNSTYRTNAYRYNRTPSRIISLDGFEKLTNLAKINITNTMLSDISALESLKTLKSVVITDCLVATVPKLTGNNGLTKLDLSNNVLKSGKISNIHSLTSLQELDLSGNMCLTATDIFGEKYNSGIIALTGLSNLNISNTACAYDINTLRGLSKLLTNVSGNFNFSCNNLYTSTIANKTQIDAVISYFDSGYEAYSDALSVVLKNGAILEAYSNGLPSGGVSITGLGNATISFLDTNIVPADIYGAMGKTTKTFVKLTFFDGNFTVVKEIDLKDGGTTVEDVYVSITEIPSSNADLLPKSDFDPYVWSYIVRNRNKKGNVNGLRTYGNKYYIYFDSDNIYIDSGDITSVAPVSLKNIDKLSSVQSLTICNAYINEGLTNTNTSITNVYAKKCVTTSAVASDIFVNLKEELNNVSLGGCFGIDYSESGLMTTISGKTINILSLNNSYNIMDNASKDDSDDDLVVSVNGYYTNKPFGNIIEGAGLLFAIGSYYSESTIPKSFLVVSYDAIKMTMTTNSVMSSLSIFYPTYGRVSKTYMPQAGSVELIRKELFKYIANFATAENRTNIVAYNEDYSKYVIYESDLKANEDKAPSENYILYLPCTVKYFGETYNIEWKVSDIAAGLLVEKDGYQYISFEIYKDNLTDYRDLRAGLKNNNGEFVLTMTATAKDKATISNDFAFKFIMNDKIEDPTIREYYVQLPDATGNLDLYSATEFFESGRLLYEIFNATSDVLGNASYVQTDSEGRNYITYQALREVSTVNFPNYGIASLRGMELFQSVTSLILEGSSLTADSMRYFRNYKLTTIDINNGDGNMGSDVNDWSFLYNSIDTLENFTYSAINQRQLEEFNFLLAYSNLKTITLAYHSNTTTEDFSSYEDMLACKQFVTSMKKIAPAVVIRINNLNFTSYANESEIKANEIFQYMNFDGSDVVLTSNFKLDFKNVDLTTDNVAFKLPAYINYSGLIYPINWSTPEVYSSLGGVRYEGQPFSATIEKGEISLSDNAVITYDEFVELSKTNEFLRIVSLGLGNFYREATLSDYRNNLKNAFYYLARITVGEQSFDTMYTISDIDMPELLKIVLPDRALAWYLPTYSQFMGGKWSLVGADNVAYEYIDNVCAPSESGIELRKTNGGYLIVVIDIEKAKAWNGALHFTSSTMTFTCPLYFTATEKDIIAAAGQYNSELYNTSTNLDNVKKVYKDLLGNYDKGTGLLGDIRSNDNYTTENKEILKKLIEDAIDGIDTATYAIEVMSVYNGIFINPDYVAATARYKIDFRTTNENNYENFADSVFISGVYDENNKTWSFTYTLPTKQSISGLVGYDSTKIDIDSIIGWYVNDVAYMFGSVVTDIDSDLVIVARYKSNQPLVFEFSYSVVDTLNILKSPLPKSGSFESRYYDDGVEYEGKTYHYLIEHMQIPLKDNNNGFSAFLKYNGNDTKVVEGETLSNLFMAENGELTNGNAYASDRTFVLHGNFTLYFNVSEDENGNVSITSLAVQRFTYVYSVLGNALAGWFPRVNYATLLKYDPDNGFYYLDNVYYKQNTMKISAYIKGNNVPGDAYPSSSYTRFLLPHYGLVPDSKKGGDTSLSVAGTNTLYFTPNYAGYTDNNHSLAESAAAFAKGARYSAPKTTKGFVYGVYGNATFKWGLTNDYYGFILFPGNYNETIAAAQKAYLTANS